MDKNGNLFFGLIEPIAIACWDSSKPYTTEHIRLVARDNERLQFASGIKVRTDRKGREELWVLTNRYQVSDIRFQLTLNTRTHTQTKIKFFCHQFLIASEDWKGQSKRS